MAQLLSRYSQPMGEAYFHGLLYDAGSYPAAIPSDRSSDKVYGELFEMQKTGLVLPKLDNYEGYKPAQPNSSLYLRKEVTIYSLEEEEEIVAWVYLYNRSVKELTQIPEGDYIKYLQ